MNIPTLCLDGVILGATSYPAGFSYSLVSVLRTDARRVSTGFLLILALPYLVVSPLVLTMSPRLPRFQAPPVSWLAIALVTALAAIGTEFLIHSAAQYRITREWPRRIVLQGFWSSSLAYTDHALLLVTALGEEIFFRMIWIGVLAAFGAPGWLAILISSAAYGFNHAYAGWLTVFSKTLVGVLLGLLYTGSGFSIWPPIAAHILQNISLFLLTRRHA